MFGKIIDWNYMMSRNATPTYTDEEMCKQFMDELRQLSDEEWAMLES